jgi:glutamyl-tRNA(Gln) amidotransferase subunit E
MRAGLEVHQQLATGKLFCDCGTELSETVQSSVTRRLRATGGENHAIDPAALFQAARELGYRYEIVPSSCLVELDEEPPHALNEAALDVALTVALLLHARPLDEIEIMRKIVVDGSNTSGFQRTALVAVDGWLEVSGKRYSVPTICLEEDAARKVAERPEELTFRLDRLGIPLIEIATGPEITSGREVREVAEELGMILRATGRVRRGIGTIREDVNVSTEGGARVEIKGVQELRLVEKYAENEEERQRMLLAGRSALRERGAHLPEAAPRDVAELVRSERAGLLPDAVRRGHAVLALPLPGFAGLLRGAPGSAERLGRELADQARATGLRGLVHSDELPGYGLEAAQVDRLRRELGVGDADAFVVVTAPTHAPAERALRAIHDRAGQALLGVPGETRDPLPDGRTRYSRPLPGRDRMYPETDVPPIPIAPERLARLRAQLPERPEVVRARLARDHALSPEVVRQLQRAGELDTFATLVQAGHPAGRVARLIAQDLPAAETVVPASARSLGAPELGGVLAAVADGAIAKEGIGPVLVELLRGAPNVAAAIEAAGLAGGPAEDLHALAARVVEQNAQLIAEKGAAAFSPLMGDLMREVRGRRDGQEVAAALRAAIARRQPPPEAGASA